MTAAEPISYTLRLPAPHTHYVEVEASVPTGGRDRVELLMAVWTPGSYLVREYSRQVEGVTASAEDGAGRALRVRKTSKNRWAVESPGAERFVLRYRVYCRDMSVRGNWVDADFALLNGAPTFLTLADSHDRPHDVAIELPASWAKCVTALPPSAEGRVTRFRAPDFDTLVDSPLVAGNPAIYEFEAGGRPHLLVNVGEDGVWDGPRSAADVKKIVEEEQALWRTVPYERYVFFNLITEAGGGLEHRSSTVLMTSRWKPRRRKSYLDWIGLVSHEFFHTWNVKRLRPVELGPFDYENEVYTRALWVAEGITNYYTDLLVCRAGVSTADEYLGKLSKLIERLETTPGRKVQSLEDSSFDAWIKLYRPDENTPNTTISYYVKGAVVAFLLDARIRRSTEGRLSLDDVLRLAYERYSGAEGFTAEEFRATAAEVAGTPLDGWFDTVLGSTEDLDYGEALDWFGLRFRQSPDGGEDASGPGDPHNTGGTGDAESGSPGPARAWLGIETRNDRGRLLVSRVRRGSPAHAHGINVQDEIIAVDGFRVPPERLKKRLEHYRPGEQVTVLVARREKLTSLEVTLGEKPRADRKLEVLPDASPEQEERFRAWLASSGSRAGSRKE